MNDNDTQQKKSLPLVLLILDGFGIAPPSRGNAISQTKMPNFNSLIQKYQTYALAAAGEAVGLPWGEPGNSEVGHLNLGAGRIVYQEVLRINKSIEQKTFFDNDVLSGAIKHCKKHNSSIHLMGLLSDGGVHSHQDHLYALLELMSRAGLKRVYIHAFLDGRDTTFDSGLSYIKQLEKTTKRINVGSIATVSGRYYAMDRDNHWDRIEKTYHAMVKAESDQTFTSAAEAIKESYARKVYDEEFVPVVIRQEKNGGSGRIQPGDSVIFFNYRPDRAREMTKAFVLPTFTKFDRTALSDLYFVTLTEYEPDLPVHVAYTKEIIEHPVSLLISQAGLSQLHIAETEKYAHVTYFFNGGKDSVFPGQENKIIPSAGVASYADKPEMSAREIVKEVLANIKMQKYHVYVINLANPDMVGHTGNLRATQKALGFVDAAVGDISKAVRAEGGVLLITADHGNAEEMVNWENGHIMKEHSANPVPLVIAGERYVLKKSRESDFTLDQLPVGGVLSDVGPTLLSILNIAPHESMTSRALV